MKRTAKERVVSRKLTPPELIAVVRRVLQEVRDPKHFASIERDGDVWIIRYADKAVTVCKTVSEMCHALANHIQGPPARRLPRRK